MNSIYNPLRLAVPVLLVGKLLLQQLQSTLGEENQKGETYRMERPSIRKPIIAVPTLEQFSSSFRERFNTSMLPVHPDDFGAIVRREVHAFSDTSKDGAGYSMYLQLFNERGEIS